jgi:hypothetical protein
MQKSVLPSSATDETRRPTDAGNHRTVIAVLAIALFLTAAFPRLWQLDSILMVDENLWYQRSARFLQALTTGQFADTVLTGHPGVTTMWSGTIGLLLQRSQTGTAGETLAQYAARMVNTPANLDALYWLRLPLALLTAAMVGAAFLLARRLVGTLPALAGASLMAFEPLFVAHSRALHHDAPATAFSLLAVLCWLLYLKEKRRGFLWLAALGIGLATLSKISSIFLLAFAGLTLLPRLWQTERPTVVSFARILRPWLTLFVLTLLAAVLAWPAMWTNMPGTVKTVAGFIAAESGAHANGTFFLGHAVADAGPLYYPVSLAFTLTPLTIIGIALAVIWLTIGFRQQQARADGEVRDLRWAGWMLAYGLLFIVFMSLIGKKQERYVLPAVVLLDLAAGWGWVSLARWLLGFLGRWTSAAASFSWAALVPVLLFSGQAAMLRPTAPYFSTYFNPLFGGGSAAAKTVLVGRGEGLDQATDYIHSVAGDEVDRIASWYGTTVTILFDDQVDVSDTAHPQYVLASDYVIIYINQLQRDLLKESIWRYLNRQPALHTVTLSGVEYAYVYPGKAISYPVDPYADHNRLAGKASLAGFDIEGKLSAGGEAPVRLYWLYQGMDPEESLYVTLLDDAGRTWGKGACQPDPAFGSIDTWQDEDMLESLCMLHTVVGTPPGTYLLRVGVEAADGAHIGLIYPTPEEAAVTVTTPSSFPSDAEIEVENRLEEFLLPQLELIGYNLPTGPFKPGESIDLTLLWRAAADLEDDYQMAIEAKGAAMGQRAAWTAPPLEGRYPTRRWQADEVVRDPRTLSLPTSLPGGDYMLSLVLLDGQGNPIARQGLSTLSVDGREHVFLMTKPPAQTQVATVGDFAVLIGYDLAGAVQGTRLQPGQNLDVALTWQAQATPDDNYVVFVQLLDAANQVLAQHDSQPGENTLITTTWAPGEYVRDSHSLALPPDLQAGEYRIILGMYLPETGERLPVAAMNGNPLGDHLTLSQTLVVR